MKNTSLARHSVRLLLFLTATLFLILAPLTGNAQNSSTVESLEGTSWQGTMDFGAFTVIMFRYVFTGNEQIKETMHWQFNGLEYEREYNYRTGEWETTLKAAKPKSGTVDTVCKYKRDGDSIQFRCDKRVWNATIRGNHMEGNVTFNEGTPQQKTVRWSIERIVSDNESKNRSNEGSVNGEIGGYEDDNTKHPHGFFIPGDKRLKTADGVRPAKGYRWVNPNDPSDFSVELLPFIGTWKYIEYSDKGELIRTSTFIYSPDGVVESIHQLGADTIKTKNNWKYTAKSPNSGVLKEFSGDELVERGNVEFHRSNIIGVSLEYTVTYSKYSNLTGIKSVWIRQ